MFVFHIGLHKTGTTTLQMLMARNADALAERDIHYPSLDSSPAHHVLESYLPEELATQAWREVRDLRPLARQGTVVLSSETFWGANPRVMREGIEGDDAKVVVYVRPYADWLVSLYSQWAKVGRATLTFDEFFECFLRDNSDVVSTCILRWADAFGATRVRVRALERDCLEGGELVDDFLAALGTNRSGLNLPGNKNPTPDWRTVELLRARHLAASGWKGIQPSWNDGLIEQDGWLWRDTPTALRISRSGMLAGRRLGWKTKAEYLTLEQRRQLEVQYSSECRRLMAALPDCRLGTQKVEAARERPFLPLPESVNPEDALAFEEALEKLG